MTDSPFSVLLLGAPADATLGLHPWGPFLLTAAADLDDAHRHDAIVIHAPGAAMLQQLAESAEVAQAASHSAVVIVSPDAQPATALALLQRGVQDVLSSGDAAPLGRALRQAIERKRRERAARTIYATDLATGLPHQAQLLEHMNHLLALREREPAPMVLIVLRVGGFGAAAARLGLEAGNVLRRKVAVRLRGALRAGDVVAAIAHDTFAVLLGHIESLAHAEGVANKLVRTLQQPIPVAGQGLAVAAAVGVALYPEHGKDAETLLRRALSQAAGAGPEGAEGQGERHRGEAANDA
jgi:diguanylate cyclase (GGDEF)-like protein